MPDWRSAELTMGTHFTLLAIAIAVVLFAGLLAMVKAGRRWGVRAARDGDRGQAGLSGAEGAVYGLLALLIAFSFSGAASRFERRRELLVAEANAIGTAYLRVGLLRAEHQPAIRDAFRQYLDSRLAAYRKLPDMEASHAELARSQQLQARLWSLALEAARAAELPSTPLLFLPPLNEAFDVATTRAAQSFSHPPGAIYAMLVGLSLVSAFIVGFGMAGNEHSQIHQLAYAAVLASTIWVIVDLEFPRLGLIRVDAIDQVLVQTRQGMN